jgi:chromosome segregation ATPase
MRRQQNDALSERLKVERARETFEAERAELETLDAERERVQKQLDDFEQKETVNKYETAELERTHGELLSSVEEMRKENDMLVKPELLKLEKDLANTQLVFKKVGDAFERDTQRKHMLIERSEMLEDDKQNCTLQLQEAKEFLQKVSVEPERIRKQAECVQKAGEKLQQEISRIVEQNKTYDREIRRQVSKRKEAEEVRNNLLHKLELHRDTISHRQRDVDAVKKNVDIEKARTHQLAELKIKLDINRKDMDDHMRHETDGMSMARKELEALRRRYRKKRTIADSANEILPTLKAQLADHEHLLRTHIDENKRCSIQIEGMKQEVDLAIARLLRQEVIEKSKRQGLESLLKEVAGMEDEIGNWSAEERRQNKLIAVLSAQREMKAREATRAQVAEKDTHEQVKVKELVILDLSKKCNEVNNRLKEFSALYDVVKNERNTYVSLIQSSSQALAEMKEKIKILMNEVCCNFTRFYPRALLPA